MGVSSGHLKSGPLALRESSSSCWTGSGVRGWVKGFRASGSLSSSSEGKRPVGSLGKGIARAWGTTTVVRARDRTMALLGLGV